jgi:parallel beta-helix repeat protein
LFIGIGVYPSSGMTVEEKTIIPTTRGNTLYVGGNGLNNYTKIQDAINNASEGDTVFVYDDSSLYYEHVRVNRSISLIGESKGTTIIDGNDKGDVVYVNGGEVIVKGFTIRNGNNGILIFSDYNTITDNTISNNKCGIRLCYQGGFITFHSNFNTIIKNNFLDNEQDAFFEGDFINQFIGRNIWRQNYWNRPQIFPKFIFGYVWIDMNIVFRIPWINIDSLPAKEPYNI